MLINTVRKRDECGLEISRLITEYQDSKMKGNIEYSEILKSEIGKKSTENDELTKRISIMQGKLIKK